ncbi:hypothetical protein [Pseudonocardia sp. TRM90224]|uniref:hypothetical protein n=1 Tax=Pseudonocardia sp. TRM90224 TaxID=2812678 RepID=UPI001E2E33D5|nr:hypothetical protein [Pseudonocardia sp. TRM90224]
MTAPTAAEPVARSQEARDVVLARHGRAALRAAFPTPPTTVEEVRVAAEELLDEPLDIIVSQPLGRTLPSAAWIQLTTGSSIIWVDRRTSPLHRIALIAHEFGHIFNHDRPVPVARRVARHRLDVLAATARAARLSDAEITAIVGRCGEEYAPGSEAWTRERAAEITGRFLVHRLLQAPEGLGYVLHTL